MCTLIHQLGKTQIKCISHNSLSSLTIKSLQLMWCHSNKPTDAKYTPEEVMENNVSKPQFGKYGIFRDQDSPIILDVEEERLKLSRDFRHSVEEQDEFHGINLARGIDGVFDIEELVQLLEKDNAQDIFVAKLPQDLKYVDYIVVVTGKSPRHMRALAEFTRKVYKRKCHLSDTIPKIEGENSKDWMALDLGNIALHIFSKQSRLVYDLESLWSVGPQYDKLCNKPEDPLVALLERHSVYLGDLQPAECKDADSRQTN